MSELWGLDFLGELLPITLAIVTIATLAGMGNMRGRLTNLREQLDDERKLNAREREKRVQMQADHAQEQAEHARKMAEAETKINTCRSDLSALTRVVTGEAHWVAIGQQLDDHHREARAHWQVDEHVLTEIRDLFADMRDALRGRPQ